MEQKNQKDHRIVKLIIFFVTILIIILAIIWLFRSKNTISGRYPESISSESLECVSNDNNYEKLGAFNIEPEEAELKLSLTFRDDRELSSISLKNTLTFSSESEAASAEAYAHAAFNTGLTQKGLSSEEFSNKFTVMDNRLMVTIHSVTSDINEYFRDYFLIPNEESPKTLQDFRNTYSAQGFRCSSSLD